jgi:hypothetical protein
MKMETEYTCAQSDRIPIKLLIGAAWFAVALALFLSRFRIAADPLPRLDAALFWIRLTLVAAGLLAAASVVIARPRSAVVLGSAALTAAIAAGSLNEWDTVCLVVRLAAIVATAGAILVLLPQTLCRIVISALILLHFVGILTAVTSVPPPGAQPMWLTTQLWTRFFRPYLQFVYLNNAYHFYAPEPGPATLLWFRLEYADGSSRWVTVPDRKTDSKDPLLLEYYRRLPIAQNVNQLVSLPAVPSEVARRRTAAAIVDGIPGPDEVAFHLPGVPQYQPPVNQARRFLESYAAFVGSHFPHRDSVPVQGIKVYRVVHAIVPPAQFAKGLDPCDPILYLPYFQGEFDAEGRLKDAGDPYLYWLIPILSANRQSDRVHASARAPLGNKGDAEPFAHLDYLKIQAGSSPWEEKE